MKITELSIRRPVGVAMVTLAVMALGVVALLRLPLDLLPDIEYPRVAVETSYPSSSPEEVERLVTERIEQYVSTVRGLRRYTSVSTPDKSRIILEFDWGTRMDFARLEIREKLDQARWSLPDEAGRPTLVEFDPSRRPFMTLALLQGARSPSPARGEEDGEAFLPREREAGAGGASSGDAVQTADFARRVVGPRLEQAAGVAAAEIWGETDAAVFVRLEPDALARLGVTASQVKGALSTANLRLPGGIVSEGHREFYLDIEGEFESLDEVGQVVVARRGQTAVLLGDVASLSVEPKPMRRLARVDGQPCLLVRLRKMAGTNTIRVAANVNTLLEQIAEESPEVDLQIIESDAGFIREALAGVRDALLVGAGLAFGVLFLFLRDWRSPLLLGIALPVSILIAFVGLFLTGTSLNVMSLGGLALGVGLLVDNGIVVLEAIHRRREEGQTARESAVAGTREVGAAIFASTLTTVVVFLPVIYVEGIAGQVFKDQALAVTFALLASLAVAVTVLPTLAARVGSRGRGAEGQRGNGETAASDAGGETKGKARGGPTPVARARERYLAVLAWVLEHRRRVLSVSALVFLLAALVGRYLPRELLPSVDTGALDVELNVVPGTPFDRLKEIASTLEHRFVETSGVSRVLTRLGLRGDPEAVDGLVAVYADGRRASRRLGPRLTLAWADMQVSAAWKRRATLLREVLGSGAHDMSIIVSGRYLTALKADAETIRDRVAGLGSVGNATVRWLPGAAEIACRVDLDAAERARVSADQIADAMQAAARGLATTTFYREDDRIDVLLLSDEGEGVPWRRVLEAPVVTPEGLVPIGRLITWEERQLPGEIEHVNGERAVRVLLDVKGANLGGTAGRVSDMLLGFDASSSEEQVSLGPEVEEMSRSLRSLVLAALLAVGLVYALLAGQFESFSLPFAIMFTVPLGIVGVVLALLLTGTGIGVMSGIGVVVLAGIVVNDGILLVDRARQLRGEGLALRDAVMQAGETRFRPVIMTTVTTVLGLLPMALGFGAGAELRRGLAITIIGGITVATVLTLVIIPAIYLSLQGGSDRRDADNAERRRRGGKG
jgi:HAE1 family hydrophobic/amphiphilic exporter-1